MIEAAVETHRMIDALSGQDSQRPKIKIISERSELVINDRVLEGRPVSRFLVIVAVNEARSRVASDLKKPLEGTESQPNPLAGKDDEGEIGLTPLQDGHEIHPTQKAIDRQSVHPLRKALRFLGAWDDNRSDWT